MLIKLGEVIKSYRKKCGIPNLTVNDIDGIDINKRFFSPTKQVGKNTSNYLVVPPNYFACNLMHVGRDGSIPLAINDTNQEKIVSGAYFVFKNIREDIILNQFLFISLSRPEFDRLATFNTDSSVRDGLTWDRFSEIKIEIPSLEIQQKYVDVYNSLLENQKIYEKGLEDLKLVYEGYIEMLKATTRSYKIKEMITERRERNRELLSKNVKTLDREFGLIDTTRVINKRSLPNYKIVRNKDIVYPPPHFGEVGTIGIYNDEPPAVVSPMYVTFFINDTTLLAEYLFLWMKRKSFMRFAFFMAASSIRDTFDFEMLGEYKVPIPHVKTQQSIIDIYNVYNKRKEINEKLKDFIKEICPILIKGAIQESKGVI